MRLSLPNDLALRNLLLLLRCLRSDELCPVHLGHSLELLLQLLLVLLEPLGLCCVPRLLQCCSLLSFSDCVERGLESGSLALELVEDEGREEGWSDVDDIEEAEDRGENGRGNVLGRVG